MRYLTKFIYHKESQVAIKVSDPELWVCPKGKETRLGNWS